MKAFQGVVTVKTGTLVGGVKIHVSAPFELEEDAQSWVDVVVRLNKECKRNIDSAYTRQCNAFSPISARSH